MGVGGWCGGRGGKGGFVAEKMGQNTRNLHSIFLPSRFLSLVVVTTVVSGKYTDAVILKFLITPGKTPTSCHCQRRLDSSDLPF